MSEENKTQNNVPFYKDKGFWLEVAKIVTQAGVAFGAAYLANKGRQQ